MPAGAFGVQLAIAGGSFIVSKLLDHFLGGPDDQNSPELAEYEARGEVRSEVSPRRWIVGRARVAGVLARHVDVVNYELAQLYWDRLPDEKDDVNEALRTTSERMEIFGYFAHVLSEDEIAGIDYAWVDGVRMNLAKNTGLDAVRDGEFGPAADGELKEPFFADFYTYASDLRRPIRTSPIAEIQTLPSIAMWLWRNNRAITAEGDQLAFNAPAHKLRQVYAAGNATDDEKVDAESIRGDGLSWVLVRLRQGKVGDQDGPWRRVPQIDYLVHGKGPSAAPAGVSGTLLDGNPAKCAWWFLTERMGVPSGLIDADAFRQSVAICDEQIVVGSIRQPPVATTQEINALGRNVDLRAIIRAIAVELGLDPLAAESVRPAYDEYHRRRLVRVVERFTGRSFAATDAAQRARVASKWNARFTGSPEQTDGTRARYRANGVIPSTAEPQRVLDGLAQAMAGSIEEHGGVWHIRAGSLSVRPGNVIEDADVVEGVVSQQLEPSLDDQPDEVHARLIQNERLEHERYVMDPVDRQEANIGEIDASNRPADVRAQIDATAGPQPKRVRDMGDYAFVTDPLQADELMRISLYQTRWNTRTLNLTVRPGDDFKFYRLSRGEPVLVNIRDESIMGERVGERTDAMRCIVVDTPRYQDNGNIELTLRQQDEETFSEKFGLVYDYNDSGDVLLIPPPPPPRLTCTSTSRTESPGSTITRAAGWQVVGMGGTGRLAYSIQWIGRSPGVAIDARTGHLTGTIPASTVSTTYRARATVTDEKSVTASCDVTLSVPVDPPVGDNPVIVISGLQAAQAGETTSWSAAMRFPETLAPAYAGADDATWTFSLHQFSTAAVPAGATVTDTGVGGWTPPAGATVGSTAVTVRASSGSYTPIEAIAYFAVAPTTTTCTATIGTIQVKRNEALAPTSIFAAQNNVTGALTTGARLTAGLPSGLALSSAGLLSGTTSAAVDSYPVSVASRVRDSRGACTVTGDLVVEVQEGDTPPGCTLHPANPEIGRTGLEYIGIALTGFSGRPPRPSVTGPDWLTVSGPRTIDGVSYPFHLRCETTAIRTPDDYQYSVRSGRARCGGTITVEEDTVPPLTMDDVAIRRKPGETYSGGLNAVGGTGALSYEWVDAVPADEIGLVLDTRSGDFSGTCVDGGASPYSYTARARKGTERTTCTVTVTIDPDTTPPPPEVECMGGTVSGAPGTTVTLARVECSVTTTGLLTIADSATAVNASGTEVSGWTGTLELDQVGDPQLIMASGQGGSFSTDIPATQALGDYTFTFTATRDGGGTADIVVTVTVTTVPLSIPDDQLTIIRPSTAAASGTFRATGGPAAGSYAYTRASGPTWLTVTPTGGWSFPAQNRVETVAFGVRVTKGTASQTFNGSIVLQPGGGDPEDPDDRV